MLKSSGSDLISWSPLIAVLGRNTFCLLTHLRSPHSNTLRVTRSAAPSTLEGSSAASAQAHLGKKGKDFEFAQLPLKVEFLECSAKGGRGDAGSADIQDLEKWLAKIA